MDPDTLSRASAAARPRTVAVLGAGITGLAAAWTLRRAGLQAAVFEASARAGGAIGSVREDGWLHEAGPNSLLDGSPVLAELLAGLGLDSRRLPAGPAARKRFVVRGGRPVAMPASPGAFLATPLFSWGAKLRLLGEPFRRRGPGGADESVAAFAERRLGREFLDYAVEPFVGGVYAGDPSRLSVRHAFPKLHALERDHGSLIRGAIALRRASAGPAGRPLSFPDGLEELPRALARDLGGSLRLDAGVSALRRSGGGWRVAWSGPEGAREEEFSAVLCALPADGLAALRLEGTPEAHPLRELRGIEHPPLVSILTGYRREDVAHPLNGFGMLVPAVERRSILGTLFSSTLFAGRAPAGHVALTSFVGGVRQPELANLGDRGTVELVRRELESLLGARGEPVYWRIRRWPRSIPQYDVGYGRFKDVCAAAEAAAPGLFIGGSCRDGVSLIACLESGRRLAEAARDHCAGLGA